MALPKMLDKCPITPECTLRKLYRDDSTGRIYVIDAKNNFIEHVCSTKSSEAPVYVFTGEWYNHRTQRVRYIGPFRSRKSVFIPPADSAYVKTGRRNEWQLRRVLMSKLSWEDVTEDVKHIPEAADAMKNRSGIKE